MVCGTGITYPERTSIPLKGRPAAHDLSSAALLGFGLDSVVEVCSAAAVAWQFSARDHDVREAREKTTLRIIALSFFALAAYVTADSAHALAGGSEAGHSLPGIVLAALSLLVMPLLHVWTITSGQPALSAHVLVAPGCDCHGVRRALQRMLREEFQITHATLQVDHLREDQDAGLLHVTRREVAEASQEPCCEDPHGPVHLPGPHEH